MILCLDVSVERWNERAVGVVGLKTHEGSRICRFVRVKTKVNKIRVSYMDQMGKEGGFLCPARRLDCADLVGGETPQ